MLYVGLDVHKRQSSYCILNEAGRTVERKTVRGSVETVLAELAAVKEPLHKAVKQTVRNAAWLFGRCRWA
jgi:hypothetical protein